MHMCEVLECLLRDYLGGAIKRNILNILRFRCKMRAIETYTTTSAAFRSNLCFHDSALVSGCADFRGCVLFIFHANVDKRRNVVVVLKDDI